MRLRLASSAAATCVVAVAVALAVPVSQLRTIVIVHSCCCPDPDDCHCPDQKGDASTQPTLRPCHRTQLELVAPASPAFVATELVAIAAPVRAAVTIAISLPDPHAAPAPARPAAPS